MLGIPGPLVVKIKEGKFIDLGDLLPEALEWAFERSTEDRKEEGKKRFPVTSIADWTLSFATFMAVAVQSPPVPSAKWRQLTLPSHGTARSRTCGLRLWWSGPLLVVGTWWLPPGHSLTGHSSSVPHPPTPRCAGGTSQGSATGPASSSTCAVAAWPPDHVVKEFPKRSDP